MIRVCPYCSNINVDKLKKTIGEENVKTGCIGACRSFSKEAVGKNKWRTCYKANRR